MTPGHTTEKTTLAAMIALLKKTVSLDLRERILAAYDAGDATREMVGGTLPGVAGHG